MEFPFDDEEPMRSNEAIRVDCPFFRRVVAILAVFGAACSSGVAPATAADDAVAEDAVAEQAVAEQGDDVPGEAAKQEPLARILKILSQHLTLGWRSEKLEWDVSTMHARLYGKDFERERQAALATFERLPKLVTDEAVAQGLPREKAERLARLVLQHPGAGMVRGRGLTAREGDGSTERAYFEPERTAGDLLCLALGRTADNARKNGIMPGPTGNSVSMNGQGFDHETIYGLFKFKAQGREGGATSLSVEHEHRALRITAGDDDKLSIRWTAEGDGGEESVQVVQTGSQCRATHIRDGKVLMNLDAPSFRECCRTNPEVVQRQLVPLLERLGIGVPAMPDDDLVKTHLLGRLRKAALVDSPKTSADSAEGLEAWKHRVAQAAAAIDAFGLMDDVPYLTRLRQAVNGDDVKAIDARLAAISANAGK